MTNAMAPYLFLRSNHKQLSTRHGLASLLIQLPGILEALLGFFSPLPEALKELTWKPLTAYDLSG